MEIELEYQTRNAGIIKLIFIGDIEYSYGNSDCGYSDGDIIGVYGNFCYDRSGKPVGELVEDYLWRIYREFLIENERG